MYQQNSNKMYYNPVSNGNINNGMNPPRAFTPHNAIQGSNVPGGSNQRQPINNYNNKMYNNPVSRGNNINNAMTPPQVFTTRNAIQGSNMPGGSTQQQPINNYSFLNTNQNVKPSTSTASIPRLDDSTNSNSHLLTPRLAPTLTATEKPPARTSKTINEQVHIFTGSAEKIIKWNKIKKDFFCYYELIASVISIQPGNLPLQQVMLMRDRKGPILQVVRYHNDHINIEDFFVGQILRCVGRMISRNTMHAVSIRAATNTEISTLQRMSHICDDAVTKAVRAVNYSLK